MAAVRMKDIARMAGVDVSTVSRALDGDGAISPETRRRVQEIAGEHDYRRRSPKTRTISYLIDKKLFLQTSHFYNRVIEGIEEEVKGRGCTFHFQTVEPGRFSLGGREARRLAGLVITSLLDDGVIEKARATGLPIVLLDCYFPTADLSAVLIDNTDGIIRGMQYLSSLGHRRIAYLTGDLREIGSEDRLVGYRKSIVRFGLEADDRLVLGSDFSIAGACRAMKGFLESRERPTAVAAVNDMAAIGAMEAIKQHGLRIPADISVLGFDDIDLAHEVVPRLSTMHVDKPLMGRLAVRRLFRLVEGVQDDYSKLLVAPVLVVRDSTAAACGASAPAAPGLGRPRARSRGKHPPGGTGGGA